jgi:hypothetical protein
MFTPAATSPSCTLDHGTPEAAFDQAAARGSWRTDRPDAAPAPAPSREHARPPVRAQPVDGYDATPRCSLDPSFWGPGLERPARSQPSQVMYQGVSCDLSTEAGRDNLEELLEADGVDYDKVANQVRAGGKRYDLDTEMGRRAFLADGQDGLIDGKWGDSAKNVVYEGKAFDTSSERGRKALEKAIEGYGVEYDRASNQVKVGGKSYDLDTRAGRAAFKNDLGDGVLDGKAPPEPRARLGDLLGAPMPRVGGLVRAVLEHDAGAARGSALRA